ncbi:MAG: P1 family peptidase, partial [Clostridium sp.]
VRDLGINIGNIETGKYNAITDVEGVVVGHKTLKGEGVASGITVVIPNDGVLNGEHFSAGAYRFNGTGELTGYHWIKETGTLMSPIVFTGSNILGLVHYNLGLATRRVRGLEPFSLGVVGETWDGWLSNIEETYISYDQVEEAILSAKGGVVEEGSVGGGTGMICFEFKGGIGTSSRVVNLESGRYTVGVLVQSNFGRRSDLTINGEKVGGKINSTVVPLPWDEVENQGSLLVTIATDAPLTSSQCERVSKRAALAMGRVGAIGEDESGDFFITFSTANKYTYGGDKPCNIKMLPPIEIDDIFEASIDGVVEAILNSITMATTTYGQGGRVAYEIPLTKLEECFNSREAVEEAISVEVVGEEEDHTKVNSMLNNMFPTIDFNIESIKKSKKEEKEAQGIRETLNTKEVISQDNLITTMFKLASAYSSYEDRVLHLGVNNKELLNTIRDGGYNPVVIDSPYEIVNIPYNNNEFKVVLVPYQLSSLSTENRTKLISEVVRVTKNDGVILIGDSMVSEFDNIEESYNNYGALSENLILEDIQSELETLGKSLSYKKTDINKYVLTII